MVFCPDCRVHVSKLSSHKKTSTHKSNCLLTTEFDNVQLIANAFKSRIVSYRMNAQSSYVTPELFISEISLTVCNLIKKLLNKHTSLKINLELFVNYILPKNYQTSLKSFNTKYIAVFQSSDILKLFQELTNILITKCSEFELSESGWSIESISHLELNIAKYNPLRAGTYIPLPKRVQNIKACLNIQNDDMHCFLWSIIAQVYPAKHNPNRVTSYPHYSHLFNISDMSFPPSFKDIKWFEKNNPRVSVNIYGLEKNNTITGPLYKTLERKKIHVNLLMLSKDGKNHFCLIKNFAKLLRSQLSKHKAKIHLCDECFMYFDTYEKLTNHNCARIQTILPDNDTKLCFSNFERTQRIPIVIYGDFECLLREYSDKNNCSLTENVQIHEATCFAYFICCKSNPELNDFVSYRGPNCSQKFVESISKDVHRLYDILAIQRDMTPLSEEEKISFDNATCCHICKNSFTRKDKIVMDHDHFTGKYRGAAHNSCNLNCYKCPFIPIIFHNLSGYDCHLFINELSNICGRINLIPKNKEKYISFTKFVPLDAENVAQLKFIDSYNFLSSSLADIVETLDPIDFINLRTFFNDKKLFDLARRKGVYCYDYVDCWERYDETRLPDRRHFFNNLTSESISEEDYKQATAVWDTFKMKNLGEYTDFYLKCDVLLLCDVFEKFRGMSLNFYNLDPCYYVSSPSLSWDAMLLYTGVKLDLISDIEIYQMLEKGIRGGLAQCSLRYAKANNKFLADYDPKAPDTFLAYLDCVNLYGHAMMQMLPMGNFRFLNDTEISNFDVNVSHCNDIGFILEVDLHYPPEIHNAHSDLPFAAEKLKVPIPLGKATKLIANLYDKYKYVIHYVHLQECLKHGLVLLKIHRILSFDQGSFLKSYIELNTSLRQQAKSTFEQGLFKKQNNSIFGKTIENKRKQVDVKLVNVWADDYNKTNKLCGAEKYISAPNFKNFSILSENLVVVQLEPTKVILDRPIYLGFTILELAKSHLYRFHYSIMKRIYGSDIQLCYTDTDSLLYVVHTNDFYKDMKKHLQYFDTSNFDSCNIYGLPRMNMQIPGYFKDEMGGDVISEFVGLRAKLYCIKSNKSSVKKAKGIRKPITKRLDIEKYKNVLDFNECLRDDMYVIRSQSHKLYTQKINKLVLNASDDKRQLVADCYSTLPWGHKSTLF